MKKFTVGCLDIEIPHPGDKVHEYTTVSNFILDKILEEVNFLSKQSSQILHTEPTLDKIKSIINDGKCAITNLNTIMDIDTQLKETASKHGFDFVEDTHRIANQYEDIKKVDLMSAYGETITSDAVICEYSNKDAVRGKHISDMFAEIESKEPFKVSSEMLEDINIQLQILKDKQKNQMLLPLFEAAYGILMDDEIEDHYSLYTALNSALKRAVKGKSFKSYDHLFTLKAIIDEVLSVDTLLDSTVVPIEEFFKSVFIKYLNVYAKYDSRVKWNNESFIPRYPIPNLSYDIDFTDNIDNVNRICKLKYNKLNVKDLYLDILEDTTIKKEEELSLLIYIVAKSGRGRARKQLVKLIENTACCNFVEAIGDIPLVQINKFENDRLSMMLKYVWDV